MSARILKYYVSGHKNFTRNLNVNIKRSQKLHSDARHKFHTFCKSCLVCNLFTLELCCALGMFSHWSSHLHTPTPQPWPKETAFGCKSKQLVQLFFGVISSFFRPEWGYKGMVDCCVRVAKEEGFLAFRKGTHAVFWRNSVCLLGMVGFYNTVNNCLPAGTPFKALATGSLCGVIGSFMSYPFEMLRSFFVSKWLHMACIAVFIYICSRFAWWKNRNVYIFPVTKPLRLIYIIFITFQEIFVNSTLYVRCVSQKHFFLLLEDIWKEPY